MGALFGVVRVSQRLLGITDGLRTAMLWTAVSIWLEPLRSTFDYGQVNVLLVFMVLCAVYSSRWWLSGLLLGLAAGVKLTPAIGGLYFVGVRRWATAVFSAVVFAATVGISWPAVGDQARYYFTDLLGDAGRVGPIGTSFNQSWRGGISRILGHDAGYGPLVLAAVAVTAVLARLAWQAVSTASAPPTGWAHRRGATLRALAVADFVDAPLGVAGAADDLAAARPVPLPHWGALLGWSWLALSLIGVPWLLSFAQPTIWEIGRPWYLAWAGLIYIVATMVTLAWIAAVRLRFPGGRRSCRYRLP